MTTVSPDIWHERIKAARTRRERYESTWAVYARLHTNAYLATQSKNDYPDVALPNGDQVKLGLVHSNIEQTLALLELRDIGVRATAEDFTHELTELDSHRESVVETALVQSLKRSGIVKGVDESDFIKRDGVIIGHGINYTYWRVVEREVELEPVPVMHEGEDGSFTPVLDEESGETMTEQRKERQVVYEAVGDEHVSPLEFLFDAQARAIAKSPWHGWERVVKLDALKEDPRFTIPDGIEPAAIPYRDLYGNEQDFGARLEPDSVKLITLWDKANAELIHFIEHVGGTNVTPAKKSRKGTTSTSLNLIEIRCDEWPVTFDHPDDSPFSFFIPIPANDHPFGVSQIEHIRNPSLEADKLRTRVANLTRQLKILLLFQKGRIDQDQLTAALRAPEAAAVGVDMQEGESWEKLFKEIQPSKIPPEIYAQIAQAKDDIRNVSGISETPFGGAETATESENQMVIGGARPKRKRALYMSFMSEVAKRHLAFLREFAPSGQTIPIVSWDGRPMTLSYGREAFVGKFDVEVLPGGDAMTASPVRQKMMVELADRVVGKINPTVDRIFLRQMLTMFDVRDLNAIMRAAALPPAPPPGVPPPGAAGSAPAINLNDIGNGQAIRAAVNAPNE